MKIAIIGWGSLIWDPGILEIAGEWRPDGPTLPIDLCRISGGNRLTLAIAPEAPGIQTHWVASAHDDLVRAAKNLRQREKTFPEHIHYVSPEDTHKGCHPDVLAAVQTWLAGKPDLEAAIWTGLQSNWEARRGRPFDASDALEYLRDLERKGMDQNAREYLVRTPAQSRNDTWRTLVAELGWASE